MAYPEMGLLRHNVPRHLNIDLDKFKAQFSAGWKLDVQTQVHVVAQSSLTSTQS